MPASVYILNQPVTANGRFQLCRLGRCAASFGFSMMAREIFAYQAPLYGRATGQIRLRPLPYAAVLALFPERPAAERVTIYGFSGGVPAYLAMLTRTGDFVTALRDSGSRR